MYKNLVTTIDFSPSGIKLVTGYCFEDKIYVLQALESDILPLDERGYIEKEAAIKSLQLLVATSEAAVKQRINNYILLLPPIGLVLKDEKNSSATSGDKPTKGDYRTLSMMIKRANTYADKEIVYLHPYNFSTDSVANIAYFPSNLTTNSLTAYFDIHYVSKDLYYHYLSIANALGLNVSLTTLSTFAGAQFISYIKGPSTYISLEVERKETTISIYNKGRLKDSKIINFGTNDGIDAASKKLNIPFNRCIDIFSLFGYRDNSGFNYETDDGLSLKETSAAFKEAFTPLVKELNTFFVEHNINNSNLPVVLYGSCNDYEGFLQFVGESLNQNVITFNNAVIGARNKTFVNCLGGIKLSSYEYQLNQIDSPYSDLSSSLRSTNFGRNNGGN